MSLWNPLKVIKVMKFAEKLLCLEEFLSVLLSNDTTQMAEWLERLPLELYVNLILISSQVKPISLKLVFTASPLDAQH